MTTSLLWCVGKHRRLSIAWKVIHTQEGHLFWAYLAQIELLGLISSGATVQNGYTVNVFKIIIKVAICPFYKLEFKS